MSINPLIPNLHAVQQPWLKAHAVLWFLTLCSCGGGSSATTSKNELPSPVAEEIKNGALVQGPAGQDPVSAMELAALPIINVKQRQLADPNVLLNLSGTVTPAAGATIVITLWTQITGPTVRIPSPLQLNNEIIIPDVAVATTLEFRLTAQDSNGKINSATASILVKPVPAFVKVIGGVFNETDTAAVFTLKLNAVNSLPVTFSYSTQDGSAHNGSDYTFTSGQIVFAAGETSKTLSVPLLDDSLTEDDETFSLQATAMDGETAHNNSGTAIIHSGTETLLPQTLSFSTPAPAAIRVNTQYTNSLAASPGTGALLYTSSNPQIATVDTNGLVTALSAGTVTITASKMGDAAYAPAEASYQLQVISANSAPIAAIAGGNISVARGQGVHLQAGATDLEDGTLPYDLLDQSQSWNSSIDGFLGFGSEVTFQPSTSGWNLITYTAKDSEGNTGSASTNVFVGNIAPQAIATEGETTSPCYRLAGAINDSNLTTDFSLGCGWTHIYLTWPSPVNFYLMEIYSTSAAGNSDSLTIEYFDTNSATWVAKSYTEQNEPSFFYRVLGFDSPGITTNQLRIYKSAIDPIKEITVYSSFTTAPGEISSSASSLSASSSSARSSIASSSTISSSAISSSSASSSKSSSSKASSSIASSSKSSSSKASSSTASASRSSSSKASSAKSSSTKASSAKSSSSWEVIII